MLFHMAEYCDTPESKDRSNREYKACLREELYHVYSTTNFTKFGGCRSYARARLARICSAG
jgi:hypothetical protein